MLTKTQNNRIRKARKMASGVQINITKSQIRKIAQEGGTLWSSIAGLSSKLLPMALPVLKKVATPLATGALSGLASLGIDKLFGKGFHITDQKVKQLIKYKDHLTPKQKQDIVMALRTGSGVNIKPTKKQIGSGIGTILASIGIPVVLDLLRGKGLQVDRERSRRSLPVHVPKPATMKKDGGLVSPMDMM